MAAVDYFLKLDGISGDSADARHKDEIDVLSFSFGETQAGGGGAGGGGAGRIEMSDLSFVASTSRASPQLFQHCAEGRHIRQGLLTLRRSGEAPQEYLKITLQDVLVSAYSIAGQESEGNPLDSFSLSFRTISIDFAAQRPDGSLDVPVHGGWDLARNVGI